MQDAMPAQLADVSPAGRDEMFGTELELPEIEAIDRPLICRLAAGRDGPEVDLEALPGAILDALDEGQDFDVYDLAKGLFELGLMRPAIALLEREVRVRGPSLGVCELMGKCLLALERPDLALLWLLRPLRSLDLDDDATFELIRLASLCQMQIEHAFRAGT